MRITLKDVARAAGVNFTLVSKYINRTPGVQMRPETKKRIEEAIRTLDYHPIGSARALRLGRSDMFGLVVGNLTNEYFAHYADVAIQEAEKLGFRLLISVCRDGNPEPAIKALYSRQVDGIVCCDCFHPESAPCPMLTEQPFVTARMTDALNEAVKFLLQRKNISVAGLYTNPQWKKLFSDSCSQRGLLLETFFMGTEVAERLVPLRELCRKRPDAVISAGWQSAEMLCSLIDREFPDYTPDIIVRANCRGTFLSDPRVAGVLYSSTRAAIAEAFNTLAKTIAGNAPESRPEPGECCFISRETPAFQPLESKHFALT